MKSAAEKEGVADKWGLPGGGEGDTDEGRLPTEKEGAAKGEGPLKSEAAVEGRRLTARGGVSCRRT